MPQAFHDEELHPLIARELRTFSFEYPTLPGLRISRRMDKEILEPFFSTRTIYVHSSSVVHFSRWLSGDATAYLTNLVLRCWDPLYFWDTSLPLDPSNLRSLRRLALHDMPCILDHRCSSCRAFIPRSGATQQQHSGDPEGHWSYELLSQKPIQSILRLRGVETFELAGACQGWSSYGVCHRHTAYDELAQLIRQEITQPMAEAPIPVPKGISSHELMY